MTELHQSREKLPTLHFIGVDLSPRAYACDHSALIKNTCRSRKMSGNEERTFIMLKVDGVQRGLIGEIIARFERKGYKLVALKFLKVSA